jgi:hypothetical protein
MKQQLFSVILSAVLASVLAGCSVSMKPTEGNSNSGSNANPNTNSENKNSENKSSEANKPNSNGSPSSSSSSSSSTNADLAGTYTVNGTGVDGKSYQGEVVVTKRDEVYQMSWTIGSESYDGVAVQSGNTVAVAYTTGENGKGCGAVIYKINSDNSLTGKWGEWGVNSAGTEKATPIGELSGSTGTFDASGTNPNGSAYKGKLIVSKGGNDTYQFAWDVGSKFVGTGVKMGDYLAAGSGAKQCGFVIYEVKGNTLEGKWGIPGSNQLGTEKAVKK